MILPVALFLPCLFFVASCASISATESFKDDLDFTIAEGEYNYAGFPLLTEKELAEYDRRIKIIVDIPQFFHIGLKWSIWGTIGKDSQNNA